MLIHRPGSTAKELHSDYKPTVFNTPAAISGVFFEFLVPLRKETASWQEELIVRRLRAPTEARGRGGYGSREQVV